jgi:hypothetical protein
LIDDPLQFFSDLARDVTKPFILYRLHRSDWIYLRTLSILALMATITVLRDISRAPVAGVSNTPWL